MAGLELFKKEGVFTTTLFTLFVDHFGSEVLTGDEDERWDPDTIELELEQLTGSFLDENLDKLMTAAELYTTDNFTRSVTDFIRICNTLADSPAGDMFDPAEPDEMAWALLEATILTGDFEQFSEEIQGYIAETCKESGLAQVPDILAAAAPAVAQEFFDPTGITDDDDPNLSEAIVSVATQRVADIEAWTADRFDRLFRELYSLHLTHTKDPRWVVNLMKQGKATLSEARLRQSSNG